MNIKNFIKKTKSSLKILKEMIKFITIFLLKYIFRLLKNIIPLKIKFLMRYKLIRYPRLIKFILSLRYWIERNQYSEKLRFIDYFILVFIRLLFIPLLKIIINKKKWESLFVKEVNKFPAIERAFSYLQSNTNKSDYKSHIAETNNFTDSPELSSNFRRIYNYLKRESV